MQQIKPKEWIVATQYFQSQPHEFKCERKSKGKRQYYRLPNGEKTSLNHSFLKINQQLYAMAGKGERVGRGAYGKVKLLQTLNTETRVVKIEVLPNDAQQRRDYLQRKQRENKVLKDLGYFIGFQVNRNASHQHKSYTIMKHLGVRLDRYVFSLELERKSPLQVLQKSIACVDQFHKGHLSQSNTRYIHADIKPPNLLVSPTGEVHLIDFWTTLDASNKPDGQLRHDGLMGTYYFMAPEIKSYRYSFASDIYALGISLNHLLPIKSRLHQAIDAMCEYDPQNRVSLEMMNAVFLVELNGDKPLPLLQRLIENHMTISLLQAKSLHALLTQYHTTRKFIKGEKILSFLSMHNIAQCISVVYDNQLKICDTFLLALDNCNRLRLVLGFIQSQGIELSQSLFKKLYTQSELLQALSFAIENHQRLSVKNFNTISGNQRLIDTFHVLSENQIQLREHTLMSIINDNMNIRSASHEKNDTFKLIKHQIAVDLSKSFAQLINKIKKISNTSDKPFKLEFLTQLLKFFIHSINSNYSLEACNTLIKHTEANGNIDIHENFSGHQHAFKLGFFSIPRRPTHTRALSREFENAFRAILDTKMDDKNAFSSKI